MIAVWQEDLGEGTGLDIVAKAFPGNGAPPSDDIRVNVLREGDQFAPAVAKDATGKSTIVWRTTEERAAVYMRQLSPEGRLLP